MRWNWFSSHVVQFNKQDYHQHATGFIHKPGPVIVTSESPIQPKTKLWRPKFLNWLLQQAPYPFTQKYFTDTIKEKSCRKLCSGAWGSTTRSRRIHLPTHSHNVSTVECYVLYTVTESTGSEQPSWKIASSYLFVWMSIYVSNFGDQLLWTSDLNVFFWGGAGTLTKKLIPGPVNTEKLLL